MNDSQKALDAPETAASLLREYRERRERFRIFDDFESAISKMSESVERGNETTAEPLKTLGNRLFRICVDAFFLIQVCEWKINYLAEALLHSIEVRNPISLASNTRGVVEHMAALTFVAETLEKLRVGLDGQGSESKINDALNKAETTLKRAYYGRSPKVSGKNEAAPHIESDCLAALEKFVPEIREVYDFLCEYVHPNYGSNLLVSTGQLGKGRLNPPASYHQEIIDRICRYCSLALLTLKNKSVEFTSPIIRLNDMVERCLVKNAKITNAFAKKGAVPQGDGQSKETAFFFKNARTSVEAVELTYRYLQECGVRPTGDKEIGAVEEGFIYDVFPTTEGRLWFKTPAMKFPT
jgi:hypothetical protein